MPRVPQDIGALLKDEIGLAAVAAANSATPTGVGIDRTEYNSVRAIVQVGALTGGPSAASIAVKIQESDTLGSGYTDVLDEAGDAVTLTLTAAGQAHVDLDLTARKKYLRMLGAVTLTGGTSPTAPTAGTFVFGGARRNPTS